MKTKVILKILIDGGDVGFFEAGSERSEDVEGINLTLRLLQNPHRGTYRALHGKIVAHEVAGDVEYVAIEFQGDNVLDVNGNAIGKHTYTGPSYAAVPPQHSEHHTTDEEQG